jgi:hypothetical protein
MAAPELVLPRETAELAPVASVREIAADRTFTEGEAYALVADGVARETASKVADIERLTAEKAALETEKSVLQGQLDVAVVARETAETALASFQATVVAEKEIAACKDARIAKVREVAAHLKDDFFTEARVDAWARKTEDDFAAYVAELAALSEGITAPVGTESRETASTHMAGDPVGDKPTGNAFFTDFLGEGSN